MSTMSAPAVSLADAAADTKEQWQEQLPPLELMRSGSARDNFLPDCSLPNISIVVLGASGDLAKKKTYPALFALFSKGCVYQCT